MILAELSRVDKSIEIQAPPERVYRALTDTAELAAWFRVSIEGEIGPGSDVWMTSLSPGQEGTRFRVYITELTRPTRVVWEWHPGAVDPNVDYSSEPRTTVTFTLEPTVDGTRLSVAETGFDQISLERRAKVYADNNQGWAEVLVWVKKHVETIVPDGA